MRELWLAPGDQQGAGDLPDSREPLQDRAQPLDRADQWSRGERIEEVKGFDHEVDQPQRLQCLHHSPTGERNLVWRVLEPAAELGDVSLQEDMRVQKVWFRKAEASTAFEYTEQLRNRVPEWQVV